LLERYEAKYGRLDKPILAGILPLVNVRHATFLHNEVPGIFIPDETRKRIEEAGENGAQVGVEVAVELIEQIKGWAGGVYIMPQFHKFDMVAEIIEKCK
jgi:homocysteine S-methyltransferase